MNESSIPALAVQIDSLYLNQKKILDQVNFTLAPSSALAVVGHNGAGKTTLFHLILGLKFITQGSIQVFGISCEDRKARMKVGYVPERPYLNLYHTLEEALFYFGDLMNLPRSVQMLRIEKNLGLVGLESRRKDKLSSFSKGMLQRTLIAQALMGDPELLILDEPMSGLDPEGRQFLRDLMMSLRNKGKTLLFSTHTLEDVSLLADEVLVLEQGKTKFLGKKEQYERES